MNQSLGFDTLTFSRDLSEIFEYDYGDFMRAANVSLNELRDELRILNDHNINQRLNRMQLYLQFAPNWDIESTRLRLGKDTGYIDDLLAGHRQDWESASSIIQFLNANASKP